MASKFQNRLVGTIILVALGVIVLPGLLDGKKKHYEDEFAAIPLVPSADESNEMDSLPALTQSLPSQPPEGAEAAMSGNAAETGTENADSGVKPESPPPAAKAPPVVTAPPAVVERPAQKPVEIKPQPKPEVKPKPEPKPETKPEAKPAEQAPSGQAYVVQLGALKNADKVNEIVAKLRLSGYRAYTTPATPVQGQITRIYVGPEASRAKLQSSLAELHQISGLNGQVKSYSVR